MLNIILASKSPRRAQILKKFDYKFQTLSIQTSEIFKENLSLDNALIDISKTKVLAALEQKNLNGEIVSSQAVTHYLFIGADTAVCIDDRILGKPKTKVQALEFLSLLKGCFHQVKTSVSLYNSELKSWSHFVETSIVTMKSYTLETMEDYILTGEPFDKAGGYGIQDLGKELVESYEGSWYNIVGFPIECFEEKIKNLNWICVKN